MSLEPGVDRDFDQKNAMYLVLSRGRVLRASLVRNSHGGVCSAIVIAEDTVAEACSTPAFARGLCRKHHAQAWRAGLPNLSPRSCAVPDCFSPHKGFGLCQKHLRRQRKGLPLRGSLKTLHPKQYLGTTRHGHPIAGKDGRVYVHRMVLFDAIGDVVVPCFWCGHALMWRPAEKSSIRAIHVDHLDHDRHNNDETNLVPACNPCNAGRMTSSTRTSVYSGVGNP